MGDEVVKETPSVDRAAKLGGAIARLKADRKALRDEVATLKGSGDASKLKSELDAAKAELRTTKHRRVFDEAAKKAKVKEGALDDLWNASGYKADADEPDAKAIEASIGELRKAKAFYFDPEEQGDGQGQGEGNKLQPGAGASRGKPPGDPAKMRVSAAERTNPQFMKANQARMAEAAKEGRLEFY